MIIKPAIWVFITLLSLTTMFAGASQAANMFSNTLCVGGSVATIIALLSCGFFLSNKERS